GGHVCPAAAADIIVRPAPISAPHAPYPPRTPNTLPSLMTNLPLATPEVSVHYWRRGRGRFPRESGQRCDQGPSNRACPAGAVALPTRTLRPPMPGATLLTPSSPAAAGGSASPAPRVYAWAGSWAAILLLVGLVTALRAVYVLWLCPYDLIEDEAHYWEWSRRLDWSYYSKGPGVALLIAAATELLGTTAGAVRLPAVLFGAVATLATAALAAEATGDKRVGFLAAAAML